MHLSSSYIYIKVVQANITENLANQENARKIITFAHAKLLEFHTLELKILNFLIQYKFQTYGYFLYYELLHAIWMPKELKATIQKCISFTR